MLQCGNQECLVECYNVAISKAKQNITMWPLVKLAEYYNVAISKAKQNITMWPSGN